MLHFTEERAMSRISVREMAAISERTDGVFQEENASRSIVGGNSARLMGDVEDEGVALF